jgi:hypothetical protein
VVAVGHCNGDGDDCVDVVGQWNGAEVDVEYVDGIDGIDGIDVE